MSTEENKTPEVFIDDLRDVFDIGAEAAPQVAPFAVNVSRPGDEEKLVVFPDPFNGQGAFDMVDIIAFLQQAVAFNAKTEDLVRRAHNPNDKKAIPERRAVEFMGLYDFKSTVDILQKWIGEDGYYAINEAWKPTVQQHYRLILKVAQYYAEASAKFGDSKNF